MRDLVSFLLQRNLRTNKRRTDDFWAVRRSQLVQVHRLVSYPLVFSFILDCLQQPQKKNSKISKIWNERQDWKNHIFRISVTPISEEANSLTFLQTTLSPNTCPVTEHSNEACPPSNVAVFFGPEVMLILAEPKTKNQHPLRHSRVFGKVTVTSNKIKAHRTI